MKKSKLEHWSGTTTWWYVDRVLHASIPFTWLLPRVETYLRQRDFEWDTAIVGGPAVELMPGYFAEYPWIKEGHDYPGVLQRVNSQATRTTLGCPCRCEFCGIGTGQIEAGPFRELETWVPNPIICDNNLLACGLPHFRKVIAGLQSYDECDFNQGLDIRLITAERAAMLATLSRPIIRLALDSDKDIDAWLRAVARLLRAGLKKTNIKSYVLVGYQEEPLTAWRRCEVVDMAGISVMPMWFHELNALEYGAVTEKQLKLGWTPDKRNQIMSWYWQHTKKYGIPDFVEKRIKQRKESHHDR